MIETLLSFLMLMNVTVTSYRSVPAQTDSSPYVTSIGHRTHPYGCAVSQDLLKSGKIKYGDVVYIPGFGLKVVNDTMHPRHKMSVDMWVATAKEEKRVGVRKLTIFVIKAKETPWLG